MSGESPHGAKIGAGLTALKEPGGAFVLKIDKGEGTPIAGIPVYVFMGSGSYLGISGTTDDQGHASFDLSDGEYKFRANCLGYQFWSEIVVVPDTLSATLSIPHQDVITAVKNLCGTQSDPVSNTPISLFKPLPSYMGNFTTTDTGVQVVFSLPERSYKVRTDYLGYHFWPDDFSVG